ncbi:hypothetical protein M569_14395, partial [Genlisea aurea]
MTRAARDRILKDLNRDIGDHLRNHVHLTNCIHVKNHMHKHSPIDRALIRDLVALQRSRSLRDPSASPAQSWHSLSAADLHLGNGGRDDRFGRIRGTATNLENSGEADRILRASSPLVEESKDAVSESDDAASSHNRVNGSLERIKNCLGEEEAKFNGASRTKRHKFRSSRRGRPSVAMRDDAGEVRNEMSVASNSVSQGTAQKKHHMSERIKENEDQQVSGVAGNGCGIPWNWSRIHDRGKSFLDMAGQTLSCGLSEPRMKRSGAKIHGTCLLDTLENSSSSIKNEVDAWPLLRSASCSQGSGDRASPWFHEHSGELEIFAGDLLKQETDDSDLISEGRSGKQVRGVHQNLTQKYMPKTFSDLIGQPLVVQALSNAIAKRKIGLLYLFYGPQGTGKTSCARIFARALNCQSQDQHSKPCGLCNACIADKSAKSRRVKEIGPISNMDAENVTELLEDMIASRPQPHYRVFIFSECDALSPGCWNAIIKAIGLVPRHVVFILVCSTLDSVPRVVISRCQKFFFPKLKDADIVCSLQSIANREGLDIDMDAVKLIASRSDGSLRDAEMTLEQLSLLGKRISLSLVQELVGLISDEKLVDLLDLALSADVVNAVKNLRDIMEYGVDPLTLMSQLATVITDILAGSFDFSKGRTKKKFFRHQALLKHEMERLRQALKTLSEAEKQLRASTDRTTWLTAALLQLAPDHQYTVPSSSGDPPSTQLGFDDFPPPGEKPRNGDDAPHNVGFGEGRRTSFSLNDGEARMDGREIEEIWLAVLQRIPVNVIREFMFQEAQLVSLAYGESVEAELRFNSPLLKSKAEKFRTHILRAFESVLQSAVTVNFRCDSRKDGPAVLLRPDDSYGIRASPPPPPPPPAVASTSGVKKTSPEIKGSSSDQRRLSGNQNMSLVRGKISLAQLIRQIDGCTKNSGWSKRKAVSIADKLEQQNLRLESKSRRFGCWNRPKKKPNKKAASKWRMRTRKPTTLLKFMLCGGTGRCLS